MINLKAVALLALALTGSALSAEEIIPGPGPLDDAGSSAQISPQRPVVVVADAVDAQLRARVLARCQAFIKDDLDVAYLFETPAYRAIYTTAQFRAQFGNQIRWIMANIKGIRYDDLMVAKVRVEVAYRYAEPGKGGELVEMTREADETWLRKDDQWWHQQD